MRQRLIPLLIAIAASGCVTAPIGENTSVMSPEATLVQSPIQAMQIPSARVEVAVGLAAPAPSSSLWRQIHVTGIEMESPAAGESFWLRVADPDALTEWTVYGPLHPGEVVAIQEVTIQNGYLVGFFDGPADYKGFGPQITIGSHRTRVGPVVFNTPSIPAPKIDITIGGGSGIDGSTGSASTIRAGLELDPVQNPSDPQAAFCQAPIRAFNRESYAVKIAWLERTDREGTSPCTGQGVSVRSIELGGGANQRVFCSVWLNPGVSCRISKYPYEIKVQKL